MRFKRTSIAAFIILLISWGTYQGYETKFFVHIPTLTKHLINFGLMIIIFAVGLYGFSRMRQRWIIGVWIPVYAIVVSLMIVIGLLDLHYRFPISNFREMVHNLRMFFSSPVPYGVLLLLAHKTKPKNIRSSGTNVSL